MERPFWLLLAWTVFGVAAAIKLWRVAMGFRRQIGNTASATSTSTSTSSSTASATATATEPFRQSLERIWAKGEDA
jgi:hypothetical protein